jgi:hypothetical protein
MAASVAAVPEIPEVDGGRLEVLPCEALLLMAGWRPDAPEFGHKAALHDPEPHQRQPAQLTRDRDEGACSYRMAFPARVEPAVINAPLAQGLMSQRGHRPGVYRPPVTRG